LKRSVAAEAAWSAGIAAVLALVVLAMGSAPGSTVFDGFGQVAVLLAIAVSGNPHSVSEFLIWFFLCLMFWVPLCLLAVAFTSVKRAALRRHV
jgi:hypothetical protein